MNIITNLSGYNCDEFPYLIDDPFCRVGGVLPEQHSNGLYKEWNKDLGMYTYFDIIAVTASNGTKYYYEFRCEECHHEFSDGYCSHFNSRTTKWKPVGEAEFHPAYWYNNRDNCVSRRDYLKVYYEQ